MYAKVQEGADNKHRTNALLQTKHLIEEQDSSNDVEHGFNGVDDRGGVWAKNLESGKQC